MGVLVLSWSIKRWSIASAVAGFTALLIAVPTGVIHTPFYTRMTPVLWWNYPTWAAFSVLAGLLAGTYGPRTSQRGGMTGRLSLGGTMSLLAIGCPVCNKVVVALLGVSGALGIWASRHGFSLSLERRPWASWRSPCGGGSALQPPATYLSGSAPDGTTACADAPATRCTPQGRRVSS